MNEKTNVKSLANKLMRAAEMTKACNRCGKTLPLDQFGRHNTSKDGLMGICRECKSISAKQAHAKVRTDAAVAPIHNDPNRVMLDFTARPDILKKVANIAFQEFRSVEKQIMYFLQNNVPDTAKERE